MKVTLWVTVLCAIAYTINSNANYYDLVAGDDSSTSDYQIPDLAKLYLKKHKGQLMTPENRMHLKPDLRKGYQFRIEKIEGESGIAYIQRLTKIKDGYYYFSTVTSSGEIYQPDFYRYKNGIKSVRDKNKPGDVYTTNAEEECKFTLGECTYKGAFNRPTKDIYSIQ